MLRARVASVGIVAFAVGGPATAGAPVRAGAQDALLLAGPLQASLAPADETPLRPVAASTTPGCGTFGCERGGHRHNGLDMTAPAGTPVRAPLGGRVALVAQDGSAGSKGYGNLVCVQHRARLATCFAHLSAFADGLLVGTLVRRGEKLGEVGSTGFSTGDHLHFEVRRGDASCSACAVDPVGWLARTVAPGPVPPVRELEPPRPQPATGDGPRRGGPYVPIPQRSRPAPAPAPPAPPAPHPAEPVVPVSEPVPAPAPVDPGTGGLSAAF